METSTYIHSLTNSIDHPCTKSSNNLSSAQPGNQFVWQPWHTGFSVPIKLCSHRRFVYVCLLAHLPCYCGLNRKCPWNEGNQVFEEEGAELTTCSPLSPHPTHNRMICLQRKGCFRTRISFLWRKTVKIKKYYS